MEKWLKFYEESIHEDKDDIQTISETTNMVIRERFNIPLESHELTTAIFLKTFETFLKKLVSLEDKYDNFEINLANRLSIGFTNNLDQDDNEKVGNFMVYIHHLHEATKTENNDDPTVSNIERVVQWNSENIIEQPGLIRNMTIDAVKALREIDIQLANNEIIMPIFITYYESIINYIKIKRRERDEFEESINFVWFNAICREGDDDSTDEFSLEPSIASKLLLKNDSKANRDDE